MPKATDCRYTLETDEHGAVWLLVGGARTVAFATWNDAFRRLETSLRDAVRVTLSLRDQLERADNNVYDLRDSLERLRTLPKAET